jgi:alpha-L-fucosidase
MRTASSLLPGINQVIAAGPYAPTWESLSAYRIPQWYQDDKFGIFIHWGVYSVPAFGNEWYPRNMYIPGHPCYEHHVATYGPHTAFGYKDFVPKLTAELFDPAAWAQLFKQAGARFVMPVAEHHDGFAMYDCSLARWNAVEMGPHRDIIGELAKAVRDEEMTFSLSSHRAEHWFFFDGGETFESDVQDPGYADLYGPARPRIEKKDNAPASMYPTREFLDDWLARTCELVDKYQPQIVWFDWWIDNPFFVPYLQRFAAFYYNRGVQWNKGVAINYKHQAFPDGIAVLDIERGQMSDIRREFWQTDTSISINSWGYVAKQDYKTPTSIIHDLIDIVSKNGALLLNIGPRPDGTIPEPEQEILHDIGSWLATNGEAIYGTRPWRIFGEGPTQVMEGGFTDTKRLPFTAQDVRFTTKDDALYAILLAWPDSGEAVISALGNHLPLRMAPINGVRMLGLDAPLPWRRDTAGLHVTLPNRRVGKHAFVLKVL